MWNRLTSAIATNGSWGEQYTFDYFGNLTAKTPTAGSAPSMSIPLETYSFTWESAYEGAPRVFTPTLEGANMYFGGGGEKKPAPKLPMEAGPVPSGGEGDGGRDLCFIDGAELAGCDAAIDDWGQAVVNLIAQDNPGAFINSSMIITGAPLTLLTGELVAAAGMAMAGDVVLLGASANGYAEIGGVIGANVYRVAAATYTWAQNTAFSAAGLSAQATIVFLSNPATAAADSGPAAEWGCFTSLGYNSSNLIALANGAFQLTTGGN